MHAVSYAVFNLLARFQASKYGSWAQFQPVSMSHGPNAKTTHHEFDLGDSLSILGAASKVDVEYTNIWLQTLKEPSS